MTHEELIAALEAAPTGTRKLGVAVLEAAGAYKSHDRGWWVRRGDYRFYVSVGDEARVVTDLNFRLPGVPDGRWEILCEKNRHEAWLLPDNSDDEVLGRGHTERLARCIAELKAALATKGEKYS